MTQNQKVIHGNVGVLELAKQLGNVSQACKMMGVSRDSFYRFRDLCETGCCTMQTFVDTLPVAKENLLQAA